jgi:hypothetical protein
VLHLIDNNVLRGEAAVDALGWAEERREALRLKQAEQEATAPDHTEVMMTCGECHPRSDFSAEDLAGCHGAVVCYCCSEEISTLVASVVPTSVV